MKIENKCLCGCGKLTNLGNKYIHGHNKPWLGKKLTFNIWNKGLKGKYKTSEETKNKISLKLKGRIPKNLESINANKNGDGNPMWKGNNVKYSALHTYIRKYKPKGFICEECGKIKKLVIANISGNYLRDINDYKWLCQKCHINNDLNEIRLGIRNKRKDIFAIKCMELIDNEKAD